jgi:tetratricopeptide (TPR) repeat protein
VSQGMYWHSFERPSIACKAQRGVISVLSTQTLMGQPLFISPDEMQALITHEIGHFLGLADWTCSGDIMSGISWNKPIPEIGAYQVEAINHFYRLADSYRRLGAYLFEKSIPEDDLYVYSSQRKTPQQVEEMELTKREKDLPEKVDSWMRMVWEGERAVRAGQLEEALSLFQQSLRNAPDPYEVELRISIVLLLTNKVQEAVSKLERLLQQSITGVSVSHPAYLHRTLENAYRYLNEERKSQRHTMLKEVHEIRKSLMMECLDWSMSGWKVRLSLIVRIIATFIRLIHTTLSSQRLS